MRDIVLTLIILGALPAMAKRPHIGVLFWAWVGYMNPHRLTWGFAYNMPFAMLIAAATFAGLVLSRERMRLPLTGIVVLLIIWNGWFIVTSFFSLVPEEAWDKWEKVFKIQLMTFITLMLMQSRERIHALVWVVALSIAFFGVKGGLFTLQTGAQYMVLGPTGSFIEGNTEIALALVMVLPLLRYLQLSSTNVWVRRGLVAAMILCGISILGSYSRGAFLAGAAMAVFLWMKSRQKASIGAALMVLLPVLLISMPDQWFSRMETIQSYEEDASAMGRINAWHFAYNLASDRPLVGGGFRTFDREIFHRYAPVPEDFHDAHSIYFEVLGEQGFVGLFIFLILWLLVWRVGNRIVKAADGHADLKWARDLASMVQVSLVGYAVGGAFLGLAYFDLPYHLAAVLVIVERVITTRERASAGSDGAVPQAAGGSSLVSGRDR